MYFLIFRIRLKNPVQYFWLLFCSGLYLFFTLRLEEHPEEALHFVEYGLLSYFIFRALSQRIRDRTIYIITILCVSLVGIADEFMQWLLPTRFWAYKDVGLNTLAAGIFVLTVWQGIRPKIISSPVQKFSLKILRGMISLNLLFLGLCLSNTPEAVKKYSSAFESLSWLQNEEPMTSPEFPFAGQPAVWLTIFFLLLAVWTASIKWEKRIEKERRAT